MPSSSQTMVEAAVDTVTYHLAKSYLTPGEDAAKVTHGHGALKAFKKVKGLVSNVLFGSLPPSEG